MDNIVEKIKKLKDKKSKNISPLDEFFETKEENEVERETKSETTESDLDIKPFGKTTSGKPEEQEKVEVVEKKKEKLLAKGIRELSFDEIEKSEESLDFEEELEKAKTTIEIKSQEPEKVQHIKLIVALLDADQFEAAHQEIDKLIDI